MNERMSAHPERETLVALMAGEENEETRGGRHHLDTCSACRESLTDLHEQWDSYVAFHNSHLKPMLPDPPRPWADLRKRMTVASPRVRPSVSPIRWVAAAAAAAIVVLSTWEYLRQPPSVSAAELLIEAVAKAPPANQTRRILVRSKRKTLVRPAVSTQPTEADYPFRDQFELAHYDWADPLSARSFQAWRSTLASSTDYVDKVSAVEGRGDALYRIHTVPSTGVVRHATLSLRQRDLAPVATELEFPNEIVEITLTTDAAPEAKVPDVVRRSTPSAPLPVPSAPTMAEELEVVAALHSIRADLGEPVEVDRTDRTIHVALAGIPSARAGEIRAALAAFPAVTIETADARSPLRAAGPSANPAADRILELSDTIMARAFATRDLAARFPAESAEQQLSDSSKTVLRALYADHGRTIDEALASLSAVLEPYLRERTASGAPPAGLRGRSSAERLLETARALDQILNRAFASGDEMGLDGVADALAQLRAEMEMYRPTWSATP